MLGYMTRRQARAEGFTHHVRLFGLIPCYYKGDLDDPNDCPVLATKWEPMEHVARLLAYLWVFVWEMTQDDEPQFGFRVTGEL